MAAQRRVWLWLGGLAVAVVAGVLVFRRKTPAKTPAPLAPLGTQDGPETYLVRHRISPAGRDTVDAEGLSWKKALAKATAGLLMNKCVPPGAGTFGVVRIEREQDGRIIAQWHGEHRTTASGFATVWTQAVKNAPVPPEWDSYTLRCNR